MVSEPSILMVLCSEVAMSDTEKESEARCKTMLNRLIAEVKRQTKKMEDLAVHMNELAVGLKAVVQPREVPEHALPPSVTAPVPDAALAPESPTRCTTSGPDSNAGCTKVTVVSLLSRGMTDAIRAQAEPAYVISSKSFAIGELDNLMPARCSMFGSSDNTASQTSAFMSDAAPGSPSTAVLLDVAITSPKPTVATIRVRGDTSDLAAHQLLVEVPPWPPPPGPGTVLELFHKQVGVQSRMTKFTNAAMDMLNSLAHGVLLEALGPARKMDCCRAWFVQGRKWTPGVRLWAVKKIEETIGKVHGGARTAEELTINTSMISLCTFVGGVDDTLGIFAFLDGDAVLSLPMFYLQGVVVFPEAALPLRVIQPRSLAAVDKAINHVDDPCMIGVVHVYQHINDGHHAITSVGTTAEIPQIKQLDDGAQEMVGDQSVIHAKSCYGNYHMRVEYQGLRICGGDCNIISSEMRLVFDASSLFLGLHPKNFSANHGMSSSRNASLPERLWEYNVNRHLAAAYGSYCYKLPRRHSPMLYKVVKHSEDYMLRKVEKPTLSHFVIGKKQNAHAEGGSLWSKEIICLPGHLHSYSSETSAAVYAPYYLGMLLQLAADKNRSVVLGVAAASYRDMLMSWVCRLRHLRVTNFVVCALDHETYEFSVLQGLPVFRDPLSPKIVSFDDCHFGTQCFQQVTKVKSRIVLEILRLGYNVLLSDVDVYWFDNPVQLLYSLGPATFAAQSDEYNETGPINLPRRLNSGFYFARSDEATITAMEMIVKHATNSGLFEQPSFYDVLCGKEVYSHFMEDKNVTLFFNWVYPPVEATLDDHYTAFGDLDKSTQALVEQWSKVAYEHMEFDQFDYEMDNGRARLTDCGTFQGSTLRSNFTGLLQGHTGQEIFAESHFQADQQGASVSNGVSVGSEFSSSTSQHCTLKRVGSVRVRQFTFVHENNADASLDISVHLESGSGTQYPTTANDITDSLALHCPSTTSNEIAGSVAVDQATLAMGHGAYEMPFANRDTLLRAPGVHTGGRIVQAWMNKMEAQHNHCFQTMLFVEAFGIDSNASRMQLLHLRMLVQQKHGGDGVQIRLGIEVLLVPWDPGGNGDDSFVSVWRQAEIQGGKNVMVLLLGCRGASSGNGLGPQVSSKRMESMEMHIYTKCWKIRASKNNQATRDSPFPIAASPQFSAL